MPSPAQDPGSFTPHEQMEAVYRLYAGLAPEMDGEAGLGGKLLYAGEPDLAGALVLRAANIAGAASLAVSADAGALRRAMRQGVLDFVVNSLDEALRILKNQVRKREPVAVGISAVPGAVLAEMAARGVQPDLLAPGVAATAEIAGFAALGARSFAPMARITGSSAAFHVIRIPENWDGPAAAFDELLLGCLHAGDAVNRRWVRLAPRYLPAECRKLRSVYCDARPGLPENSRVGASPRG